MIMEVLQVTKTAGGITWAVPDLHGSTASDRCAELHVVAS